MADQLDNVGPSQPLNYLIPKFLQFFRHQHAVIRSHAIACVNQFIIYRSQALVTHMGPFVEVTETEVRIHHLLHIINCFRTYLLLLVMRIAKYVRMFVELS